MDTNSNRYVEALGAAWAWVPRTTAEVERRRRGALGGTTGSPIDNRVFVQHRV